MAEIIQRLTGKPLDVLANENIFGPLGMKHSMYNPPRAIWPEIAPTEFDSQLRHRLVQGEVHDENAFAIGGGLGDAGGFRTAAGFAGVCQMCVDVAGGAH